MAGRRYRVSAGGWPDLLGRDGTANRVEVSGDLGIRHLGAHLLLEQLASPSPSPDGRTLLELIQGQLGELAVRFQLVEPFGDVGLELFDVAAEFDRLRA